MSLQLWHVPSLNTPLMFYLLPSRWSNYYLKCHLFIQRLFSFTILPHFYSHRLLSYLFQLSSISPSSYPGEPLSPSTILSCIMDASSPPANSNPNLNPKSAHTPNVPEVLLVKDSSSLSLSSSHQSQPNPKNEAYESSEIQRRDFTILPQFPIPVVP